MIPIFVFCNSDEQSGNSPRAKRAGAYLPGVQMVAAVNAVAAFAQEVISIPPHWAHSRRLARILQTIATEVKSGTEMLDTRAANNWFRDKAATANNSGR